MNWLTYFQKNRHNRPVVPWETGVNVPAHVRKAFIRSLQKFQIGESGEGRHLRRLSAATGDKDYAAAMELFVREEQRHGALMAQVLKGLNATLLTSDWTDNCFVFMRHLSGLHTELLVVLMPEMIAKVYFSALWRGFSNPVLESVFGQIVADEEGHLAFHADYLNSVFSKMSFGRRILVQLAWRLVFRAVCLVVYYDHGSLLRGIGMSASRFWRECGQVFDEVAAKIFSPTHVLQRPSLSLYGATR
jgi:hypothetical protein